MQKQMYGMQNVKKEKTMKKHLKCFNFFHIFRISFILSRLFRKMPNVSKMIHKEKLSVRDSAFLNSSVFFHYLLLYLVIVKIKIVNRPDKEVNILLTFFVSSHLNDQRGGWEKNGPSSAENTVSSPSEPPQRAWWFLSPSEMSRLSSAWPRRHLADGSPDPLAALHAHQEPHGPHHPSSPCGGPRGPAGGRAQTQEGPYVPVHLPCSHQGQRAWGRGFDPVFSKWSW